MTSILAVCSIYHISNVYTPIAFEGENPLEATTSISNQMDVRNRTNVASHDHMAKRGRLAGELSGALRRSPQFNRSASSPIERSLRFSQMSDEQIKSEPI